MAFIEMSCKCEASFQAELSDDSETLVTLWAQSFVQAHRECGFMNSYKPDESEKYRANDVMYKERKKKEIE
jgi:hypothetical protein